MSGIDDLENQNLIKDILKFIAFLNKNLYHKFNYLLGILLS